MTVLHKHIRIHEWLTQRRILGGKIVYRVTTAKNVFDLFLVLSIHIWNRCVRFHASCSRLESFRFLVFQAKRRMLSILLLLIDNTRQSLLRRTLNLFLCFYIRFEVAPILRVAEIMASQKIRCAWFRLNERSDHCANALCTQTISIWKQALSWN